jgi:hypothetical protein
MTRPELSPAEEKSLALKAMLAAWEDALKAGVSAEALASTAIFAALTDMVDAHGAEAVATFCETLPARVRAGEFTLKE